MNEWTYVLHAHLSLNCCGWAQTCIVWSKLHNRGLCYRWRYKHLDNRTVHANGSARCVHDRRICQLDIFLLHWHDLPVYCGIYEHLIVLSFKHCDMVNLYFFQFQMFCPVFVRTACGSTAFLFFWSSVAWWPRTSSSWSLKLRTKPSWRFRASFSHVRERSLSLPMGLLMDLYCPRRYESHIGIHKNMC